MIEKKQLIQKGILILSCMVICFFSSAQDPFFKNYTVNDGLPSSQVYDIVQDNKGYLWFATDRGLAKFNGYSFESYTVQDGLKDNCILRFYQHQDGTIWCITLGNQLFYIDHQGNFVPYQYNEDFFDVVQDQVVTEIIFYEGDLYIGFLSLVGYVIIDKHGKITFSEGGDCAFLVSERINNKTLSYKVDSSQIKMGPLFNKGKSFYLSSDKKNVGFFKTTSIGNVALIGVEDKLFFIDSGVEKTASEGKQQIGLGVYDSTHFWAGFRYGGAIIYDLKGNQRNHFLEDKSVTRIFNDHEGGVWISTLNSGVFYFNNQTILTHNLNANISNRIHSLTSDEEGRLYVGYYNGYVYQLNKDEQTLIYKPIQEKPAELQYYKSQDKILIGADDKVFESKNKQVLYDTPMISFSDDKDDKKIVISTHRRIIIGDERPIIPIRAHDVCVTDEAILVSSSSGVFKYENDTLMRFSEDSLFNVRVDDIDYCKDNYYAASLGQGVIIFNRDTVFNIDVTDGLYSSITTEVVIENDSTVWVCTNKGLNKISFQPDYSYSIKGISYIDGLASNEVFDIEIIGNTVWVATASGLCSFKKGVLEEKQSTQRDYYLSIKEVIVNDQEREIDDLGDLSYKENRIRIDYEGVSFQYNENLVYRYKLVGLEDNWNFTNSLSVTYPSLPSNKYDFVLQAKGEMGKWEDNQLTFPITISPAYYKTWWFYTAVILSLFILIYLFFKYNILSYNKDIMRELLRKLLKFLSKDTNYILIKEKGTEVKIRTTDILYVKASGNYLELFTTNKKFVMREKISNFLKLVPDSFEFLRVHRSYIVRIDKVEKEDNKCVYIKDIEIPVGEKYKEDFKKILL